MAKTLTTKTPDEVKRTSLAILRKEYNDLAKNYNKLMDHQICYCHKCDEYLTPTAFYNDNRFDSGLFPICKKCLFDMAMDYDKSTKTYKDNREKTIEVFRLLNLPFIDSIYKNCVEICEQSLGERNKTTAFQRMVRMVKTLNQYSNLHWEDSEFDDDRTIENRVDNRTPRVGIRKLFGNGFTNEEYLYLQDQYDDWRARTAVDSKSQETYIVRICFKLLDIWKAQRDGKDTTKLDESLNKLMDAAKLQPKQNSDNAASDSLSFGELIEKWESEKPIPEVAKEYKDVDKIGKYIRIWFTGWLSKVFNIKNPMAEEFEEEVKKYTVDLEGNQAEKSSAEIYNKMFGKNEE